MPSIRRRLIFGLLGTVLALTVVAGAALYRYVEGRLTRGYDQTLSARAKAVAAIFDYDTRDGLEYTPTEQDLADYRSGRHPLYFQVWREDGTVVARSPSLGDRDLPKPPFAAGTVNVAALPDGHRGRLRWHRAAVRVELEGTPVPVDKVPIVIVAVAQEPHELNETLGVLASALAIGTVLLAAGTALAVMLTVRRAMAPLDRLGREADAIGADSLDHQFSLDNLPEELRPIAGRLNALLGRLSAAFERERRFTADVAHELRTPVAELKAAAEVALKWPEDADHRGNYRETLDTARRMEALITRLLSIARCEAGKQTPRFETLDLCEVVRQAWAPHEGASSARRQIVTWDVAGGAVVRSDRAMLLALIDNLISNAVTYTPAGGSIDFAIGREGGAVRLMIRNACDNLVEADLPYLYEAFWRKDPSRTDSAHCGLGLTLAAAYAKSLRVGLEAGLPAPQMFLVTATFSAAPAEEILDAVGDPGLRCAPNPA